MKSQGQFFSLTPTKAIYDFIIECKRIARSTAGDQDYLEDSPHLTLYVGDFNYSDSFYSHISDQLNDFVSSVKIIGWNTFFNDAVTGGHSLVLELEQESTDKLRSLQMSLVKASSYFRKKELLERYSNTKSYSPEMLNSLQNYGFPYVGGIWRAHFTIASFKPEVYESVFNELNGLPMPKVCEFSSLQFRDIQENNLPVIYSWDNLH